MNCARVDVKPINMRRRSVERVHASRFNGRGKHGEAEQARCHGQRNILDEL